MNTVAMRAIPRSHEHQFKHKLHAVPVVFVRDERCGSSALAIRDEMRRRFQNHAIFSERRDRLFRLGD